MLFLLAILLCYLSSGGSTINQYHHHHHLISRRDAPQQQPGYGPPGHIPGPPLQQDGSGGGGCVKTTPEENKASVVAFYEQLFGRGHTEEGRRAAVAKYIGPDYIQHNPMTLSGPENLLKTLKGPFWQALTDYKIVRLIAEDDFVVVHDRMDFGERSFVFLDILRFECGKVNEHWDVIQPITGKEVNPLAFF